MPENAGTAAAWYVILVPVRSGRIGRPPQPNLNTRLRLSKAFNTTPLFHQIGRFEGLRVLP